MMSVWICPSGHNGYAKTIGIYILTPSTHSILHVVSNPTRSCVLQVDSRWHWDLWVILNCPQMDQVKVQNRWSSPMSSSYQLKLLSF